MLFYDVSESFEAISHTSSRTEITTILAHLFNQASPREARIISYLTLGLLRPPYESTQFGLAAKSIEKVLAELFMTSIDTIARQARELGDLGLVAGSVIWQTDKQLTVEQVYGRLAIVESTAGTGSQEEKAHLLLGLLQDAGPQSAKTIVRMVLGKLRLGFSDMTLIDALSWMLTGDKSLRHHIENAYNICADIGLIAERLRAHGIAGLDEIGIVVGIPIRPALAERLPTARDIIKKLGPCVVQPKLDGFRLQVHIKRSDQSYKTWFFSRNLIDMSAMFPDLVEAFKPYDTSESLIVDGEALVYDTKRNRYLPFQETVRRKRKHDIEEMVSHMPLRLILFDIFYYNGHSQLEKSHVERRKLLLKIFSTSHNNVISVIDERAITTAAELEEYFNENIKSGLEGVVVKRPDTAYQPGKRNFNWIKLKKGEHTALEDTIDAVILGYYYGKGKRSTFGVGAFLVGVYDKAHDVFETIAKVGTGLKDEDWIDLKKRCDARVAPEKPTNVVCSKALYPDVWAYPEIVCVIRADDITQSPQHTAGKTAHLSGLALRFPRFVGYRPDKSAREATTVDEIRHMWQDQGKVSKPISSI